jgi:SAM-dependent methyltransferase
MPLSACADVRFFYEAFPYPPPVDDLESYRQQWRDNCRRLADFHLLWPAKPYSEAYSILVAGCGTSQAAKYAIRRPAARVVGIDFSATSVSHTAELKRKHRLDNLELRELSLERAADLGMRFDHIVCTGVLHHLADPGAGLSALRDVLAPDGAMHVMVYAPYGRYGIYMLQDFFRRVGSSTSDIGDVVAALKVLPSAHPLKSLLREAPDFRNEAGIADALLNPCDRAYSVPEFLALLRANGLVFGRWLRQAPYSLHVGIMSRLPNAIREARIAMEDQYAAAELFRGTMMRHSAIVYRDDNPSIPRIAFTGNAWRNFVPIRVPESVCIVDQLPAGAAAILVNRAHSHTDIYLPLRTEEKRLFDAIDGEGSIGEIALKSTGSDITRTFLERLWSYDQTVFAIRS